MTIEEKAKAYDEALEKARMYRDNAKAVEDYAAVARYENIFPELRESEDERMLKKLIEGFKNYIRDIRYFNDIDVLDILNFLEKQKNKKFAMIQWTGKNLKEVIDFTGKSQKFGEWFKSWEEYEKYVYSHGNILKLFKEDGSHYEVPVGAWIVKTPDGYNIPSRFRFIRKPAEWSEEDEKMYNSALWHIKNSCGNGGKNSGEFEVYQWFENRIKSLRPQPQQNMSISFMLYLDEIRPEGKMCLSNGECNDIEDAFKKQDWPRLFKYINKYQPHWKPSKEQVEELWNVISYIEKPDSNFLGVPVLLESLYKHLKELM